jgi:bacterioferritin-associated ferredoxin
MTDVGVRKVPMCFLNFSLHCLMPQRVSEKSYGPCSRTNSNRYVKLIPTTIQEINRRTGSVGQCTLCARFARQNSKKSFQYCRTRTTSPCCEICSRTCEARLEAIYEHVYEEGQAEVQNLTLDFVISLPWLQLLLGQRSERQSAYKSY